MDSCCRHFVLAALVSARTQISQTQDHIYRSSSSLISKVKRPRKVTIILNCMLNIMNTEAPLQLIAPFGHGEDFSRAAGQVMFNIIDEYLTRKDNLPCEEAVLCLNWLMPGVRQGRFRPGL